MNKLCTAIALAICSFGFVALDASSAQAQTVTTQGYVRSMQLNGPNDDLVVTISTVPTGGSSVTLCVSTQTYAVFYGNTSAPRDAAMEGFRAMLQAALLAGRQISLTSTFSASECQITQIAIFG